MQLRPHRSDVASDLAAMGIVSGSLVTPLRYSANAYAAWSSGGGAPRLIDRIVPDEEVVLVLFSGAGPMRNGIHVLLPSGKTAWANGELFRLVQSPPAP